MWIQKIFAREFGFSDVQSNYSRVYAWMANQLGHMTLGLATVFFFIWIAETVSSAGRLFVEGAGPPTREAGECQMAIACFANNVLLVTVSVLILAAMAYVGWKGVTAKPEALPPRASHGYTPLTLAQRQALNGVFLGLLGIAFSYLLAKAFLAADAKTAERHLDVLGVATACFAIFAGVLVLCKDLRYFTFALIAVFGAFWIATDGAGAPPDARRWIAAALAILFGAYALYATILGRNVPEKLGKTEQWALGLVIVGMSVWFILGTWHGLEHDWPKAIAAGIASCSLWWVKEFGSDLPNVQKEIAVAASRRPPNLLGECPVCESGYIDDARMDARTDALFYFAGAWIGAGVVSATPVMTATSWASGS